MDGINTTQAVEDAGDEPDDCIAWSFLPDVWEEK